MRIKGNKVKNKLKNLGSLSMDMPHSCSEMSNLFIFLMELYIWIKGCTILIPCEKLAKGCDTCDSDDVNNYVRRGRLLKYIKKNNLGKYQVYLENSKTRRNSF